MANVPGEAGKAGSGRSIQGVLLGVMAALGIAAAAETAWEEGEAPAPGSSPRHGSIKRYQIGAGPRSYWLFEPSQPKPERAPVVVFLHGWFAVNPAFYGAWIDHLVRSRRIVVFPRYQNDFGTAPREFLPNALAAIRDALAVLEDGDGHVRPEHPKFALIGHSLGGSLAAQIAAVSSDPHSGVPQPRAVITLMAGELMPAREPPLSRIPATTLLVVVAGEDDLVVGDLRSRQIFAAATAIPRSRKRFVLFRSDRHGFPPLVAEHFAATGSNRSLDSGDGVLRALQLSLGEVNVLDWGGFWRLGDLVLDASFQGLTLDDALPNPNRQLHLGYWSDGRIVQPPLVADNLEAIPGVIPTNGIRLIPWSRLEGQITTPTASARRTTR